MNMKLIESKIDPDTKKAIYETDGKFYYCAGFVQDTISPKTFYITSEPDGEFSQFNEF